MNYRCPQCGSNNTQLTAAAYQQAVRSGKYKTISAWGQTLAPPSFVERLALPGWVCLAAAFVT